jgi:hypothetical protein
MRGIRNKPLTVTVLCLIAAFLNVLAMLVFRIMLGAPLYLDTVFTAAMTFYGGLLPGVLTGAMTNLVIGTVWVPGRGDYLYTLCNITVALVTALFVRLCPDELDPGHEDLVVARRSRRLHGVLYRVTALFLLAFALAAALSVSGGLIAFCIKRFIAGSAGGVGPEQFYALSLKQSSLPALPVEILSRIPVNIIDRLVTVFCGYALARGLKRRGFPGGPP